jgi:hypothetical protein
LNEGVEWDFDCDGTIQKGVFSLVNLTHVAGTNRGEDFVDAEFGSRIVGASSGFRESAQVEEEILVGQRQSVQGKA